MNKFVAEIIGTALLITLGDGVVANVLLNRTKGNNSGWIVITFGWGMAVFVAVWVLVAVLVAVGVGVKVSVGVGVGVSDGVGVSEGMSVSVGVALGVPARSVARAAWAVCTIIVGKYSGG